MRTETERASLASPEPDAAAGPKRGKNPVTRFLGEMPGLIIMSLLLAILIKTFLVQAFYIPSGSMENTLRINDRVLVSKVPYYLHDPQRGDIVVFKTPPEAKIRCGAGGTFVKRIIGLPGERIEVRLIHDSGYVFINGQRLTEPYIDQFARYFLMPRRPSSDAEWILCYGCDQASLERPADVVWDDGAGISILRATG